MIDAKELRIGNLLSYRDKFYPVERIAYMNGNLDFAINCDRSTIYANESIKPIPLTSELLEKCGFKKEIRNFVWHTMVFKNGNNIVFKGLDLLQAFIGDGEYKIYMANNIKYLHQLQNLYYALTQTELEIKL